MESETCCDFHVVSRKPAKRGKAPGIFADFEDVRSCTLATGHPGAHLVPSAPAGYDYLFSGTREEVNRHMGETEDQEV